MLQKKVFQMFITGSGECLNYVLEHGLGGVIFFKDDIISKSQFIELINNIKKKSLISPFLSIDQEGGRVERTENIHPKKYLSPKFAYERGDDFLINQTKSMLSELKDYGINMNFAPCLDVNSNPSNPIIGERAFSDNPTDVCHGYDIVSPLYKNFGIISVIKHFPGHGDTSTDSHKTLPIVDLEMDEFEKTHIAPFKHAINSGAEIVMVAHIYCKCFDKDTLPASLSKNCINYLKNVLNFNGLIISDDMYMNGVSKYGMTEACVMGIKAGLNMFIYRETSENTLEVIENVIKYAEKDVELREKIEISYNKILKIKEKYFLHHS